MALHQDLTTTPFSSAPLAASSRVPSLDDWGHPPPCPSVSLEVPCEDGMVPLPPGSSWPVPAYPFEPPVGPAVLSTSSGTTVSTEEAAAAMEVRGTYFVIILATHM